MVAVKSLRAPLSELHEKIQELCGAGYLDITIHFAGCKHEERQGVDPSYVVIVAWGRKRRMIRSRSEH